MLEFGWKAPLLSCQHLWEFLKYRICALALNYMEAEAGFACNRGCCVSLSQSPHTPRP